MPKILLVDSDALCYQSSKETIEESIQVLNDKIANMFKQTEADYYLMAISEGKYFRHSIYPAYKAQRGTSQLKWLRTLKAYLKEEYGAVSYPLLEADDVVSYFASIKELDAEYIIASPDKDVLFTIPGKHFNYTYRSVDSVGEIPEKSVVEFNTLKGWWVETSEEEARQYFSYLMIGGDASDNILTPFPANCAEYNHCSITDDVLNGYINGFNYITPSGQKKFKGGLGVIEGTELFNLNYRLISLLNKDNQEWFIKQGVLLPELGTNLHPINKEAPVW